MIGICNVIFGAPFVEQWNSICLPTELSPSNVKALNSAGKARYIVYTNEDSLPLVQNCVSQRKLNDYFNVDVHVLKLDPSKPHLGMTLCHQHCIANYKKVVEGILFSSADDCYHENYYQQVYDNAISKNKACITFAARISLSCFRELSCHIASKPEFDYETAVSYLHRYLHPLHQDQVIDPHHRLKSKYPAVLFEYTDNVLTMRGFHMHPIYVYSEYLSNAFTDTIDGEFVESMGQHEENYTLMSGLNAPFILSLTADMRYWELRADKKMGFKHILRWIYANTNSAHKDFFTKHAFVTSLSKKIAPDTAYDYSPQLTALKRVVARSAIHGTNRLGATRYKRILRSETRVMALLCLYYYLLEKIRIKLGLPKKSP